MSFQDVIYLVRDQKSAHFNPDLSETTLLQTTYFVLIVNMLSVVFKELCTPFSFISILFFLILYWPVQRRLAIISAN